MYALSTAQSRPEFLRGAHATSIEVGHMSSGTGSHRDTDELLRLVADRLPLLGWISGSDKRCTYFNRQWLEFTGRPLESEIGDGWAEGVHPADLERCLDTYTRAFDRREPFLMEYRLRRHDGEYRWVLDNAAPLFDPDGSFAGYIGTAFDVTEFRRAEAERNVANDRLRLAMESGKSVGWEWDLKTDCDTWFGDLLTVFGIPSNIHVGHVEDFRRSVHPEDRGLVWKAVRHAMETHSPYVAEFRILWQNGTVRWVAARGQFYYSPGGEPERMLGMAVDITERKDNEESLRRKEMELKEAQRLAGVGSWQWDPDTDTVVWSEELYRMAGRDPSLPAVSYKEHSQLYPGESWERLRGAVEAALHTGAPYELDLKMVRPDSTHRWVRARGEVQRDATDRIVRLRGTVHDISERKTAEDALASMNRRLFEAQEVERARIARDLHDDIGQRLALLAVALEQVKELQPDSSGEALSRLNDLQKQTAEIMTDVQALSHELHPPRLLLLGVVAAMRGFCREVSGQKNVEIDFRSENVPASVPPDVSLCLFRVLQEAVNNAVRHSKVRHFDVHLRGTAEGVDLTIRDEGVGFDVDSASRGMGLGLTSMNERLKLVGGELLIESQSTRGTTVLARAPVHGG
jgi:PAS domain S-box-containing protein